MFLITQQPLIYGTSRTMFDTEQFLNTCIWVPINFCFIQDDSQTHDYFLEKYIATAYFLN